jgi:hypothetical protein
MGCLIILSDGIGFHMKNPEKLGSSSNDETGSNKGNNNKEMNDDSEIGV